MRTPGDSVASPALPVIAALDMGYGHLRAAAAIASASGAAVVHADRPPIATEAESRAWARARRLYEGLSRAADAWYAPGARRVLEFVTGIPDAGPGRDLCAPNLAARQLRRLVADGLGDGLARHVRGAGAPLVSTFYSPAIAADAHGAERVFLVVTDSDVNRVWVPADPRGSAITYLVPTEGAARRLASYGVPGGRIRLTGFPLPPELVGDDDRVRRANLAARLARLDPLGAFRRAHAAEIRSVLGGVPGAPDGPATIVFAVGGAGAQSGVARTLLRALRAPLEGGELRLLLVAGARARAAADFERWIAASGVRRGASVLFEPDFPSYYARFNAALATADALWTKPSELTFYAALGIPLLLAQPLGVHEGRNRAYAAGLGAAIDARNSRTAAVRIASLLRDGTLAEAAWAGFTRMPHAGTARILGEALIESPRRVGQ